MRATKQEASVLTSWEVINVSVIRATYTVPEMIATILTNASRSTHVYMVVFVKIWMVDINVFVKMVLQVCYF